MGLGSKRTRNGSVRCVDTRGCTSTSPDSRAMMSEAMNIENKEEIPVLQGCAD